MKNNKKKILIYSILGIITVLIVTLTVTYAYWILTRQQTGENVVNTACLNISFTGENDIILDKAYPMKPEQLESFLSTETPYHFTIHNECNDLASASINLESLTVSGKALEDEYIDAILYETDYHVNLNSIKKLNASMYNDANKVITDAKHAYSLYNFNLKPDETRDFNLLLYMDPDTPMEDANMNASWKGKITLSTGYKVDSKMLKQILPASNDGVWGYKDKLTKIVIEDSKSVKAAPEGGQVYGPFDESEYETKAIESYVVCEADDTNCIGYLQSDGKVILNPDSSWLFAGFSQVTNIEGLENLDTNNVINMFKMFDNCRQLKELNLSGFVSNKVNNINEMFNANLNLNTLDLSNWDLSGLSSSMLNLFGGNSLLKTINMANVTFPINAANFFYNLSSLNNIILDNVNTSKTLFMSNMFAGCSSLQNLDLSSFDMKNVVTISNMFSGMTNLQELNLSNWDISASTSSNMFGNNASLNTINMTNATFPVNCNHFFSDLSSLNNVILDNVDTSNTTNISYMFQGCTSIQTLNLSSFDTSNLNQIEYIFSKMTNLQELDLSNWKFNNSLIQSFSGRTSLKDLNKVEKIILDNVDTVEVTNMSYIFSGCSSIKTLDLSSFDMENVTNVAGMFSGMSSLQELNLSNWKFNDNIANQFTGNSEIYLCSSLNNLILKNANTSEVTNMNSMFAGLSQTANLVSLDLSDFDTSNVTDFYQMFASSSSLQHITFGSNFVHKPEARTIGMFFECPAPERPSDDSWSGVVFD